MILNLCKMTMMKHHRCLFVLGIIVACCGTRNDGNSRLLASAEKQNTNNHHQQSWQFFNNNNDNNNNNWWRSAPSSPSPPSPPSSSSSSMTSTSDDFVVKGQKLDEMNNEKSHIQTTTERQQHQQQQPGSSTSADGEKSSNGMSIFLARRKSSTNNIILESLRPSRLIHLVSSRQQQRSQSQINRAINQNIPHSKSTAARLSGGGPPEGGDTVSPSNGTTISQDTIDNLGAGAGAANIEKRAFLGTMLRRANTKSPEIAELFQKSRDVMKRKLKEGVEVVQDTSSRVGPSVMTAFSALYTADKRGISFITLYAIALFGASCGFYMFLYFITLGYALGITLPLAAALYVFNKHTNLHQLTILHSTLTLLWGIRIFIFFLWREYVSWPALHQKVVELQTRMNIPFVSRFLCWCVYSFFYIAMMSMNWSRLVQVPEQSTTTTTSSSLFSSSSSQWGVLGYTGLILQIIGLALETIADLQKNDYKSKHRHSWCNVGIWKFSTHPNYLGEGLFWFGTYLGHGFDNTYLSALSTIGLLFIMIVLKGSTRSLSKKQLEKYGERTEFNEFQRTHTIWGPKWWSHGREELSSSSSSDVAGAGVNNTTTTTTTTTNIVTDDNSISNVVNK